MDNALKVLGVTSDIRVGDENTKQTLPSVIEVLAMNQFIMTKILILVLMLPVFASEVRAEPILEFAVPRWIEAPINTHVVIPLLVRNVGTEEFIFRPTPNGNSNLFGNFWIGGSGTGVELDFLYRDEGPINSPQVPAPAGGFFDQDFFDEFNGVVLSPGNEEIFNFFSFSVNNIDDVYFSGVLGTFGGRFSVQLNYSPLGLGLPLILRRTDTFVITGAQITYGDFNFDSQRHYEILDIHEISDLSSIPEPTTFLLFGSGFAILLGLSKKAKTKRKQPKIGSELTITLPIKFVPN